MPKTSGPRNIDELGVIRRLSSICSFTSRIMRNPAVHWVELTRMGSLTTGPNAAFRDICWKRPVSGSHAAFSFRYISVHLCAVEGLIFRLAHEGSDCGVRFKNMTPLTACPRHQLNQGGGACQREQRVLPSTAVRQSPWEVESIHRERPVTPRKDISSAT